jgi:hypothetical protein
MPLNRDKLPSYVEVIDEPAVAVLTTFQNVDAKECDEKNVLPEISARSTVNVGGGTRVELTLKFV